MKKTHEQVQIIDTFPDFLKYWEKVKETPGSIQLQNWISEYMNRWPELKQKQIEDYESRDENWKEIALERIFPIGEAIVFKMRIAHKNILSFFNYVYTQAKDTLGFEGNVTCLIYVGIGCGAGWVTEYDGNPAILFGLENIVACNWHEEQGICGLIAHELGHVIHSELRRCASLEFGSDAWWQLYSEGFAQQCEQFILGRYTWHEVAGVDQGWLSWCDQNKTLLASKFLFDTKNGRDLRSFFGSWYNIAGYSQCGYYLGYEVIKYMLSNGKDIREIALLDNPEATFKEILENFI